MERRETLLITQSSPSTVSQANYLRLMQQSGWGILMSSEGMPFDLEGKTVLGRIPPANITISDSRVSAKHFEIYFDQETQRCSPQQALNGGGSPSLAPFYGTTYWVRDLSTNGTFVNHRKIGRGRACRIETGDEISIVQLPPPSQANEETTTSIAKRARDGEEIHSNPGPSERRYLMSFNFHPFAMMDPHSPPLNPSLYPQATPPAMPSLAEDSQATHVSAQPLSAGWAKQKEDEDDESPHTWQWGRLIGRGAQSQVYQAIDTSTGEMMAVKVLKDLMAELRKSDGSLPMETSPHCSIHNDADPLKTDEDWDHHNPASSPEKCQRDERVSHPPGTFLVDKSSSIIYRRGSCGDVLTRRSETWDMTPEQRGELRLLRKLSHRRIVQYRGIAVQDEMMCILLEYVAGGSLQSLVNTFGWFGENVVKIYTMQILQGLEYLHHQHVVHGDIKPANILVSDKGQIKLTDFGTGKILKRKDVMQLRRNVAAATGASSGSLIPIPESLDENPLFRSPSMMSAAGGQEEVGRELVGTPHWMSPEFCKSGDATFASDIWALGCVVLEMATGELPWSEHPEWSNPVTAIFNIASATFGPSLEKLRQVEVSEELLDFLNQTFLLDPHRRPTASQLLMHPFITQKKKLPARPSANEVDQPAIPAFGHHSDAMPPPSAITNTAARQTEQPKFQDHIGFLCRAREIENDSSLSQQPPSGLTAFMRDL
ncbi:protein kinase, putative [Bodo saltans]|uniref:Protein kinase, putative n=1 Tax=Bodo saltans TaxID=75058 RepID=A0A0S4JIX7_BODSA|nr:protein kinase, putative [Bodo saltans]|eukprot:CUG90027.1 protein kinase, putative [Bodo saltans]